jgi:4,4'-diaponeurosporenoate glycosyltransferase
MTTDPWMLLMITGWISGSVAVLDAARGLPTDGLSNWVVAGLMGYFAYVLQIRWLLRKLGNFGLGTALTYPLSLAFFISIFLRSLYFTLVRNSVRWKGRSIPVRSPG